MSGPIPTLRGSQTHELAVALYRGHTPADSGRCGRCQTPAPCPVRQYAAWVIQQAGEDARWYDQPPAGGFGTTQVHPDHTGFHLGTRHLAANRRDFPNAPEGNR